MARFEGKVALVTGGGSGIGEAIAKRLAAEGASVVVSDISADAAQRVVGEITATGGTAAAVVGDVSTAEGNEAAVRFTVDTYGKLNLAVNNAGIGGAQANLADVELDDWKKVIDLNLNGVFYGMKYEIPEMLKDAANSAIVNMASIHGSVAALGSDAYTTSKHAVVGMTKNAAAEYGPDGLRINSVGPGYIKTPLLDAHLTDEMVQYLVSKHPLGRLGTAEEVASLTCFLLSGDASFCTGGYYLVDGGYTSV
ncbi:SDR family NAD(P)-dependent oxidoreductase [Microbacterium sp.]|uniref:SDR family NAD(P)-dependent oxidoreductase n=1 Tax=Microbacterium sp. TaxID=51671 RepID=UPI003A862359